MHLRMEPCAPAVALAMQLVDDSVDARDGWSDMEGDVYCTALLEGT